MSTILGITTTYGSGSSPSRKTGTTQSTLTLNDYRGNVTTVTTAKGPSKWEEEVTNTSPSLSDSGEATDAAQESAKRSDEITFFRVGKAIPLNKFRRNHVGTETVASETVP
jgi:hypothetical protein